MKTEQQKLEEFKNLINNSNNKLKYYHNINYWKYPNLMNCMMAGIVASDGNLFLDKKRNTYTFQYKVAQKDKCLVELFKNELDSNATIESLLVPSPKYPDRINTHNRIRINRFENCASDLRNILI